MNRSVMISKAFFAGILLCSLAIFSPAARGDVQTNVFTGTVPLNGDISSFFDSSGNPLPGVCVSNSPAPSITGAGITGDKDANGNSTAGLGKSPVGVLGSLTGNYHPSGFNQRRLIAAYNPNVNGGTIYVGVDLPGGSGSTANPDYMDPLTCGGSPPCPTSITPPIQRGSVLPFDADGNGNAQTIGTNFVAGGSISNCNDASLITTGAVIDIFTCGDAAGASGATDDPSNPFESPGAVEDYALSIIFSNGMELTADFREDNTTPTGHAEVITNGTSGFGVMVSADPTGVPLGWDVEFAITNVNAVVDPCTRLNPVVTVTSGSNGDGPAQGEDTEILRMQYVLPSTVQCQVLLYTNDVQVVTNLCGQTAFAGVNIGDTVETRVVVTAGAGNAENLTDITISNYVGNVTNAVIVAGPLAPGQSVTNSLGTFTCEQPGYHGVMAVVNAQGDITASCTPIMSECDSSFECCGTPGVSVTKLVACRPAGGACALVSDYGKSATGTVTQTQSPAFCYSILVSNTGNVTLNLSNIDDNVLGDLTSFFPGSLPPNGTAIEYFVGAYTNDTVNEVMVSGNALVAEGITTNVMASDSAMVHVVPASVSCEKLVSTNGSSFFDQVSVLADGNPHDVTYEVIVTAGANSPLANVTVTDPTLAGLGCTNPPPFSLAAGAQTNILLCTVPILCETPGDETNTVSVNANVDSTVAPFICALDTNGAPITVNSSCPAVVSCIGTASITVVKDVICQPAGNSGPLPGIAPSGAFTDPYAGQKSAIGVIVAGTCPSFSYRVIVMNNGQLGLNNVTATDTLGGSLLPSPVSLAPGASVTNIYTETLCSNTVNTVTATGVGTDSSSVTATDSASVTIESTSMSCTELVSTDGVNFASSATILQDGNSHSVIYQLTVQNNSGAGLSLNGFSVSDAISGCLGGSYTNSLEPGTSFTVTCTNVLNCANVPAGGLTDTATVTALVSPDSGVVCMTSNTVATSCSAVVNCICVPQIAVSKAVACVTGETSPSALPGSAYGPTATGVANGTQCPTFAYRIIVSNTGTCPLTSVTLSDSLLGTLTGFPTSLAPGATATNFYSKSLCVGTVNTVVASGVSAATSSSVSATNSASVSVLNASMSCTKLVSTDGVNFASSATIVQDGNAHQVIYELTVQNTSSSGVLLSGFSVSDANGCLGSVALPASLGSSASFTITCTNELNCTSIPGGTLTDTATVTANVDSQGGSYCVTSSNGSPISVSTYCSASVSCTAPPCVPKIVVIKNVTCRHGDEDQNPKDCGRWNCNHVYCGSPTCSNGTDCSSLPCSDYDGQTSATSVVHDGHCPAFCYRIIVVNAGTCTLTNVVVSDPLFGGPLAGYPSTLAPGASATNFYTTALCSNSVNTVIASGSSASSNTNVTSSASASVTILDASVTCTKLVSTDGVDFAESVNVPQDGEAHEVIYKLIVQNTSDSGVILTNISISDVNGCFSTCALPSSLSSGGSFTLLCTNLQNCTTLCTPPPCKDKSKKDKKGKECATVTPTPTSTSFTDTVDVVAEATSATACHHPKVTSTCSAVVNCVPPPCTPAISVTKEVVCRTSTSGNGGSSCGSWNCSHVYSGSSSCQQGADCSSLPCSAYEGNTSATAINLGGGQCPDFCYRIIVRNSGTCPLTGVSVVDPLFGGALAGYPTSLAAGASATNFYTVSLCTNTVNTVVAKGTSSSDVSVSATNSASVTIVNASVSCSKLASTDGVNFAESVTIPADGSYHTVIYKLTVYNTSSSGVVLTNINVVDVNGCLSTCKLPKSLASGASFTVLCTNSQNCTSQGCTYGSGISNSSTNLVTVTAQATSAGGVACGETTVTSTCWAVVNCVPPPCTPGISVTKDVVCRTATSGTGGSGCGSWNCSHVYSGSSSCQQGTDCSSLPGSVYDGSTSATAISLGGGQCPDFCYRIIVRNGGTCPLTGVSVVDPLFGGTLAGYPTSLAAGASATNFYTVSLCSNTVNSVVAKGTSSGEVSVSATNSASVTIVSASVSCSKLASTDGVNFAESVTIPVDGSSHTVIYKLTVSNTSSGGVVLSNINVTDVNGCLSTCALPKTLASGASFTVLCTNSQNCASQGCTYGSGISNSSTNLVTVTAQATSGGGVACGQTTVTSTCWAVVNCVPPPCTPKISVTKCVVCCSSGVNNSTKINCSTLPGSSFDGHTSCSGSKPSSNCSQSQCPQFCFRIIVSNTGTCPLTGVAVSDPLLGGTLSGYPASLAPGASATNFFYDTLSACTTNIVSVSGTGSSGGSVSASASAIANVVY